MYHDSAQGDYIGTDGTYRFYMNVCGITNTQSECTEKGGLLCQYKQGEYLAMVSSWTANPRPTWSLINKANPNLGVEMYYANGDTANCGSPRKSYMNFQCDPNAPLTNTFAIYENNGVPCTYYIALTSPGACPVGTPPTPITSGEPQLVSLATNSWVNYTIVVDASIIELQVTTSQTSVGGYLQLYVRYGALATDQAYDRADLSYANYHAVAIGRQDPYSSNPLSTGTYYIGVRAMIADTSFILTAQTYICYNNCSSQGTCVYNNLTGFMECDCNDGYNSNFRDCSAQVVQAESGITYNANLVYDQWRYYRLEVNDANPFQLFVELNRASNDPGLALPALLIKKDDFPTFSVNDGLVQDRGAPSQHLELEINAPILTAGVWIIGVVGSPDTLFFYSLTINVFDCNHGCSDHGICHAGNNTCQCDPGYTRSDCSLVEAPLIADQPSPVSLQPFQTSYFIITVPTLLADSHVDLLVEVVESSTAPRLLLNPGSLDVPTERSNFLASPLPLTNNPSLRIPAASLEQYDLDTKWYLGIVSNSPDVVEIQLLLSFEGYCPNDCSANGTCFVNASYNVFCVCAPGWTGGACDVESSTLEGDTTGVSDGTFAGLVIAFFIIGAVIGFFVKTKYPALCAPRTAAFSSVQTQYAAVSEAA